MMADVEILQDNGPPILFTPATGSGIHRAMACPESQFLPWTMSYEDSDASVRGTVLHRYVEEYATLGRETALSNIEDDDLRDEAAAIEMDAIPEGAEHEVALAYNPVTKECRRLSLDSPRAYPYAELPGWHFMTLDIVGVSDGCAVVIDLKTGADVGCRAKDFWQLRAGAVAVCALTGLQRARVTLFYVWRNGQIRQDWHEFDIFDIQGFADDLANLFRVTKIAFSEYMLGRPPSPKPGPHCKWCRAINSCPAQIALVKTMVPDLMDVQDRLLTMTPAQQGEAYDKFKRIKGLMEIIEKAFRTIAETHPIPLPGGGEMRIVNRSNRKVDPGAVSVLYWKMGEKILPHLALKARGLPKEVWQILENEGLVAYARSTVFKKVGSGVNDGEENGE